MDEALFPHLDECAVLSDCPPFASGFSTDPEVDRPWNDMDVMAILLCSDAVFPDILKYVPYRSLRKDGSTTDDWWGRKVKPNAQWLKVYGRLWRTRKG